MKQVYTSKNILENDSYLGLWFMFNRRSEEKNVSSSSWSGENVRFLQGVRLTAMKRKLYYISLK